MRKDVKTKQPTSQPDKQIVLQNVSLLKTQKSKIENQGLKIKDTMFVQGQKNKTTKQQNYAQEQKNNKIK